MRIQAIIDVLEAQGEWVDRRRTRDHVLHGSTDADIQEVGICWVATTSVIEHAASRGIHFLISHENPFYLSGTGLASSVLKSQAQKRELLNRYEMTVYRCHDLWDLYPGYGVRDRWVRTLGFGDAELNEGYISIVRDVELTGSDVMHRVVQAIEPYDEHGVEVIGDTNRVVHTIGVGTGACTDIVAMVDLGADACIVTGDGIKNWADVQWAMDQGVLLVVVNHMTSEMPGMYGMQEYLAKEFPKLQCSVFPVGYELRHVSNS